MPAMVPTSAGAAQTISVALFAWISHACPSSVTAGASNWSKPAPVSVSGRPPPTEPLVGAMEVTTARYVKLRLPLARPAPSTVTATATPPSGDEAAVQVTCVLLACTTAHVVPPRLTAGAPPPPLSPLPTIVSRLPTWPTAGEMLCSCGGVAYVKGCSVALCKA